MLLSEGPRDWKVNMNQKKSCIFVILVFSLIVD